MHKASWTLAAGLIAIVLIAGADHARAQDDTLAQGLAEAVDLVFVDSLPTSRWGPEEEEALDQIARAGDPRLAWIIADMLRFTWRPEFDAALTEAAADLLDIRYDGFRRWHQITGTLIARDVPAPPGYLDTKRAIFTNFVPGWERIIVPGEIDWRLVSWGGVPVDDRAYGDTDEICACIPAIDDPDVSTAQGAAWLEDDDIVFGLTIGDEARAYPRRIMEVREMVNDTLGGRDVAIPYCTLCGAAQAYFTDALPEGVARPIMRTSGLLIRSNKVMFDIESYSVFDTFRGVAVTGPLAEIGLTLPRATIITTTWGDWRTEHPHTTVLLERDALGRDYDLRNTRDADGPIFPVGDVDPRLEVQTDVVGVISPSLGPVAFPRLKAMAALTQGATVALGDVTLELYAGGLRAKGSGGQDLGSHEAFWFAWSQFHPETRVWGQGG